VSTAMQVYVDDYCVKSVRISILDEKVKIEQQISEMTQYNSLLKVLDVEVVSKLNYVVLLV